MNEKLLVNWNVRSFVEWMALISKLRPKVNDQEYGVPQASCCAHSAFIALQMKQIKWSPHELLVW